MKNILIIRERSIQNNQVVYALSHRGLVPGPWNNIKCVVQSSECL